ncbi:MAG: DM13 domain-containing protein [Granulosicoccaceae bacterium]
MLLKNVFLQGFALSVALVVQGCSSSNKPESTTSGNSNEPAEMTTTEMMMEANAPRNCGTDHPAVGQEAELSTIAHNVSGTVRVIDNCTLQITDFTYDGRGPTVFFWGGVSRDYVGPGYFQIGEKINGRPYDNETVVIDIPEDKTLNDFDSLSVWCFQFGANFGDAMWNISP